MAAAISMIVGNTSPPVEDTVTTFDSATPNGDPLDLTNATVRFRMRLVSSSTLKVDHAATIRSALAGTVEYLWAAADVDTAGVYAAWFSITFPDTSIQDTPEFSVRFTTHAPLDGYTSVAAVRDYLSKDDNDIAQDELIADLIVRYSRAVDDFCQVNFTAQTSATKRFAFRGNTVSFSRYGLNAASAVTLSPESQATVLTANTDYVLLPLNKENGTYTSMRLNAYLIPSVLTASRMGFSMVDVTGTWGITTTPSVIEYAVVRAVSTAIRRDVAIYTQGFADESNTGGPAIFLPADVRAALQPYRRMGY